jgi:hypothetical protein
MTPEEEKAFLDNLILKPYSMQGDICFIPYKGEEQLLKPKIGGMSKPEISSYLGNELSWKLLGHFILVYPKKVKMNSNTYNKEASRLARKAIYGNAIYAPSELINI